MENIPVNCWVVKQILVKLKKKGQYEPARIVTGLLIPFYSIKDYNCIHEA